MGYQKGDFPCKYIGIQLDKGVREGKTWNLISEKID